MPANPGERHHKAKLTAAEVIEARRLYAAGGISFMKLAQRYDYVVEENAIRQAVRGVRWKHLPGAVPRA